jgi:hypothetical protein
MEGMPISGRSISLKSPRSILGYFHDIRIRDIAAARRMEKTFLSMDRPNLRRKTYA